MKLVVLSVLFALSLAAKSVAEPRDADCPLVHPSDPKLRFIGASLDQHTDGPPPQPDAEDIRKLPDGTTRNISHYASYWFYRDAVMICAYSEVKNRRAVRIEERNNIRIPLPGILMRCDGILREYKSPYAYKWKRRYCVHDPDL